MTNTLTPELHDGKVVLAGVEMDRLQAMRLAARLEKLSDFVPPAPRPWQPWRTEV